MCRRLRLETVESLFLKKERKKAESSLRVVLLSMLYAGIVFDPLVRIDFADSLNNAHLAEAAVGSALPAAVPLGFHSSKEGECLYPA